MGYHLTGLALKNLFSKPFTSKYPIEPQVYKERTRGHVEVDINTCILCSICARNCPATAIVVDKASRTFTIDYFSCVQCDACVRSCPKNALSMKPDYSSVATSMQSESFIKPPDPPKPPKGEEDAEAATS